MSTTLPKPAELIERLVRDNTPIVLETFQGFEIAAVRNHYANGFAVKVFAQDLQGLGTRSDFGVGGFKTLPSRAYFAEIVQNARDYITRNTSAECPVNCRIQPYVKPEPVQFFGEDGLELFQALVRESAPVNWQNLSVNRLASIPSFQALVPEGTTLHECLQHLQEIGAVKLWATERDGFKVGITARGRAFIFTNVLEGVA